MFIAVKSSGPSGGRSCECRLWLYRFLLLSQQAHYVLVF